MIDITTHTLKSYQLPDFYIRMVAGNHKRQCELISIPIGTICGYWHYGRIHRNWTLYHKTVKTKYR